MSNFKVENIERITFSLPQFLLPYDIIYDIEKFVGVKNCVIQLCAYQENKYTVIICSSEAINKLMCNSRIVIGRKMIPYQFCEKTITRIRLLQTPSQMKNRFIDNYVRNYGRVVYSEIEKRSNGQHSYFAVVDLKRPLPERISIKRRMCEVLCF